MDKIAPCWKRVGIALNMEPSTFKQYRDDHHDSWDCAMNMLTDWLNGRHQRGDSRGPVTWEDLVQALRESNEHETAGELEDALTSTTE